VVVLGGGEGRGEGRGKGRQRSGAASLDAAHVRKVISLCDM
jgi:hypothetical protein